MDHPLFLQCKIRPTQANSLFGKTSGAMATVIVFAATESVAKSRSGRFIASNHWEIEEVVRLTVVCRRHVENFSVQLKKVYRQAEQYGIAACFDSWGKHPTTGIVWRRDDSPGI
jgi:hypothetical protein